MNQFIADALAPDADMILALATGAIDALPLNFRKAARQVILRIQDLAEDGVLSSLGIDDPYELTGLYDGVPLTEKSASDPIVQPDQIVLFRLPILLEWIERGDVTLGELVTHVFVHELAHHFGWTDDDIARIDPWWE